MRKLLLIGLALVVMTAGCKKASNKTGTGPSGAQPGGSANGQPSVHGPTGVVINSGAGGGSGGAVGSVHQAVKRIVTQLEMKDIHLLIETASTSTGQMPDAQVIMDNLRQSGAKKAWQLVQDGVIVLTGTRSRENIWAYSKDAQNVAGEHFIITASGVDRMTGQTLAQRLREQGQ